MVPPAKQRFNTSIMLMICDMINNFLGVIQMLKIGEAICYTTISIDYIIILKWTTLVQKRLASLI